ncbi:hypothetical protein EDD85DRAFT_773546, partial [Armillaria nabsnona]
SDEGEFESDSLLIHDTRGQLESYANAQMASQYRTHLFVVFICADRVFCWSFSHADDVARGWDASVIEHQKKRLRCDLGWVKTNQSYYSNLPYMTMELQTPSPNFSLRVNRSTAMHILRATQPGASLPIM